MYGYYEYTELEPEDILNLVSQEDIFNLVIDGEINIGRDHTYLAPYRDDNIARCYFEEIGDVLYFVDFADSGSPSKDCFGVIGSVFELSFPQTLDYICEKLNLGNGNSTVKSRNENDKFCRRKKKKLLRQKTITIFPRPYNYKDKKFWEKYGISMQNLIDDKVIPIQMYSSYSKKGDFFSARPLDITYAYTDFPEEKKKIYRPHSRNPDKEKWFTNCNQNDIGGIDSLNKVVDQIVVTKSYKDWRVLKNQGVNTVWFQNEGMIPSKELLSLHFGGFKEIIVWFDNDSPGIAKATSTVEYLKEVFPQTVVRKLFLPPVLLRLKIKDPSDLISKKNKQSLTNFLKEKNIKYYGR